MRKINEQLLEYFLGAESMAELHWSDKVVWFGVPVVSAFGILVTFI